MELDVIVFLHLLDLIVTNVDQQLSITTVLTAQECANVFLVLVLLESMVLEIVLARLGILEQNVLIVNRGILV